MANILKLLKPDKFFPNKKVLEILPVAEKLSLTKYPDENVFVGITPDSKVILWTPSEGIVNGNKIPLTGTYWYLRYLNGEPKDP